MFFFFRWAKKYLRAGTGAILLAGILNGCSREPDSATVSTQTPEQIRSQVVVDTGIDLVPLDFLDWDLQITGIAGQIVVMNFWTTWCAVCVEDMPTLVDLSRQYPKEKVRFISVNIDDYLDEDASISALDYLVAIDADIENYQLQQSLSEIYEFFGLSGIPAIRVYNRTGDEQLQLQPGDYDIGLIQPAIDELLATPISAEL